MFQIEPAVALDDEDSAQDVEEIQAFGTEKSNDESNGDVVDEDTSQESLLESEKSQSSVSNMLNGAMDDACV